MKVTQEMISKFYDQLAGGYVMPEEAQAGLQAVLDLIEHHGFIAEVDGDEVHVIAHRVYRQPDLARAIRDGLSIGFRAEIEWRAEPAVQIREVAP